MNLRKSMKVDSFIEKLVDNLPYILTTINWIWIIIWMCYYIKMIK